VIRGLERERPILVISAASTLAVLVWLLWLCRYGIDFTDESFYLVWMSNPSLYKVSSTQFGFVYHPLYELLGGRIALLRQVGILITVALAWGMGAVFMKAVFGAEALKTVPRLVVAGALATPVASAFVFSGMWLATPSYNSLTVQGLIVALTGMLLADKTNARESLAGWLLIGAGGYLTFMAKPTSAAVLAVLATCYLLFSGKFSIRNAAFAVVLAVLLLVATAFAIDGSIAGFVGRLKGGVASSSILAGGQKAAPLLRFDDFLLGAQDKSYLIGLTLVFFSAATLSLGRKATMAAVASWVPPVLALASVAIIAGVNLRLPHIGPFQGLLYFSVPSAAILFSISTLWSRDATNIPWPCWALGLTCLFMPYAFAFGTGNNYWVLAGGAGIFWVFSGLVFLKRIVRKPEFKSVLLSLGLSAQLVAVMLVHAGIATPYRQPQPLLANNYPMEVGAPGSRLILEEGFGRFIAAAVETARQAGFAKGTPMVDLTGRSPGVLYAIGASSIGQPWTLGGYPGSERLATEMLKSVSCADLARAWLLVEPEGPGQIPVQMISSFGANPATDFEEVGSFQTAVGVSGYSLRKVQKILKPIGARGLARPRCIARRPAER
jgi:hypothetical protein